jgi:hypothetical protein
LLHPNFQGFAAKMLSKHHQRVLIWLQILSFYTAAQVKRLCNFILCARAGEFLGCGIIFFKDFEDDGETVGLSESSVNQGIRTFVDELCDFNASKSEHTQPALNFAGEHSINFFLTQEVREPAVYF